MEIKVENLCKDHGEKALVEDVSFEIRTGQFLGILGPTGSGKTTVMRMLMDIIKPDNGQISFDEQTMNLKIRDTIGYLPQDRGLYEGHTVNQVLVYFARLKNLSRKKAHVEAVRLMDRFNVIDQMDVPVSQLSAEVRHKVQVMIPIIHNPDLLILDEPFANLSPINLQLTRSLLQRLKDEGKTVIIASSQFDEAEMFCDEMLLLHNGRVVLQGKLDDIRKRYKETLIVVEANDNLESLQNIYGIKKFVLNRKKAHLYVDNKIPPQKILDVIVKSLHVSRVEVSRPGLSDIYLQTVYGKDKGNV